MSPFQGFGDGLVSHMLESFHPFRVIKKYGTNPEGMTLL
jgi:hypothetical protein